MVTRSSARAPPLRVQVDPLFTLSLADPTAPRVLGELKIPGYSDYLHPVGEHALLGVGKAGDDSGRLRGVKLALFNISDLTSPRIVASVELGGPGSRCAVEDDPNPDPNPDPSPDPNPEPNPDPNQVLAAQAAASSRVQRAATLPAAGRAGLRHQVLLDLAERMEDEMHAAAAR